MEFIPQDQSEISQEQLRQVKPGWMAIVNGPSWNFLLSNISPGDQLECIGSIMPRNQEDLQRWPTSEISRVMLRIPDKPIFGRQARKPVVFETKNIVALIPPVFD